VGTAPGTDRDISNAGINVYALRTDNAEDIDGSVAAGGREGISFGRFSTAIRYAVVYGDGQGRPDSLRIVYQEGGAPLTGPGAKPSRVTLTWGGVELTAESAAINVMSDVVLCARFTGDTRPTGKTSIAGFGRGLVKVYGGSGGAEAVEDGFEVCDGVGPVLANGAAEDGADGSAPLLYENVDNSDVDTIVITFSEDIRDVSNLTKLLYTAPTANPGEPSGAVGGVQLTVLGVTPIGGRAYKLAVRHTDDGPIPGGWLRLNPGADAVADNAATQSAGIVEDNRPHPANRWVQLKMYEMAPDVMSAWYTADNAAGKPDYAYVVFNKQININEWFEGGAVNFGAPIALTAQNIDDILSVGWAGDTLRINLRAAAPALASSTAPIRTSGDIRFTLSHKPGKEWAPTSGAAKDRAGPVLAKPAVLKTGSPRGDGSFNQDTLVVYYSEPVNPASAAGGIDNRPLRLRAKGGAGDRYGEYPPVLRLNGAVYYDMTSGFYVARYVVEPGFPVDNYPESGDSVQIYSFAMIGDDREPSNVQGDPHNKWQPLVVVGRGNAPVNPGDIRLSVAVSNNPLRRGGADRTEVVMSFNTVGMDISASIRVYDNRGNTVLAASMYEMDAISWRWDGCDRKGRLVDVGTYRFKAVCNITVNGRQMAYAVEKSIGVVPDGNYFAAEAAGEASGNFTAGSNPAVRFSGGVGFFWDGAGIKSGALSVYDASGNLVKRVGVSGEPADAAGRRKVGEWDLTDVRGRAVADGSYAVTGAFTAKDGKKRRVSAVIGVGR
jgi:flagellar hook assembly protein FlgD